MDLTKQWLLFADRGGFDPGEITLVNGESFFQNSIDVDGKTFLFTFEAPAYEVASKMVDSFMHLNNVMHINLRQVLDDEIEEWEALQSKTTKSEKKQASNG
jgi:hypothetical protein